MSLKALARKVIERESGGGTALISEPKKTGLDTSPQPGTLREKIAKMLADGPKPYEEILAAVGGNEDALREAIWGWDELVSATTGETTLWEIRPATAVIAVPAVFEGESGGITATPPNTNEQETPENLGNPIFWHRGVPLAWEKDTSETKVYAWGLANLFPGRPLSVDINSTARLLGLTPREVRESLARLAKDGDLIRTVERGRELFRLNVQYPEGETNATGS